MPCQHWITLHNCFQLIDHFCNLLLQNWFQIHYCQGPNYSGSGKMFPGINCWTITDILRDRPCLELLIVSSNYQALLFLQNSLLESVSKLLVPLCKRVIKITGPALSRIDSVIMSARTVFTRRRASSQIANL